MCTRFAKEKKLAERSFSLLKMERQATSLISAVILVSLPFVKPTLVSSRLGITKIPVVKTAKSTLTAVLQSLRLVALTAIR